MPVTTRWLDQTRGLAGGGGRSIATGVAFLTRYAGVPSASGPGTSASALLGVATVSPRLRSANVAASFPAETADATCDGC